MLDLILATGLFEFVKRHIRCVFVSRFFPGVNSSKNGFPDDFAQAGIAHAAALHQFPLDGDEVFRNHTIIGRQRCEQADHPLVKPINDSRSLPMM